MEGVCSWRFDVHCGVDGECGWAKVVVIWCKEVEIDPTIVGEFKTRTRRWGGVKGEVG